MSNKITSKFFIMILGSFLLGATTTAIGANGTFGGGNGLQATPYIIEDAADLNAVRNGLALHYVLANDIDLTSYGYWTPIGSNSGSGSFSGSFNGAGHKITGLNINSTTLQYAGLFGYISNGTVANLRIENVLISNHHSNIHYTGGIAGYLSGNCIISNCYATGTVSSYSSAANDNCAGGIAGYLKDNSTISNCYAIVAVSSNSSNYPSLSSRAGGIAGWLIGNAKILNCVALNPSINATGFARRVVVGGSSQVQNNYALNTMSVTANGSPVTITDGSYNDGTAKTDVELQSFSFWYGAAWDIANPTSVWKICDGEGMYPSLRWQNRLCIGLDITNLQNQLNTANGTITTLQGDLNTANQTISNLEIQNTNLQNQLGDCENEKDNLQELLDACLNSSSAQSPHSAPLKIYPNPVKPNGTINIENEVLKAGDKLEIFDMNGKLISVNFAEGTENSINIGALPQGTYLLRLAGKRGVKFEVR